MKKIWLVLFAAMPIGLLAQTVTYTINGTLKNMALSHVYLFYGRDGKLVVDSAAVKNGRYTFTGTLPDRTTATLSDGAIGGYQARSIKMTQVFLANESFTVTHTDSFTNITITGSNANRLLDEYHKAIRPYEDKLKDVMTKSFQAKRANDTTTLNAIRKEAQANSQEMREKVIYPFIKGHPDSDVALFILNEDAARDKNKQMLQTLFDGLNDTLKNSPSGKNLQTRLAAMK